MKLTQIRDNFEKQIVKAILNTSVFYKSSYRLPNISVISIPNVMNESLIFRLNEKNIFPFFNNKTTNPITNILINQKVDSFIANCSLSFCFDKNDDIESIVKIIKEESENLLSLSKDL